MKHYVHNYILNPVHPLDVTLVGCGGTGSQVLTALGRMNHSLIKLGHPGLMVNVYDGDEVTEANCGRQLFSVSEIGRNKAEVLVTKLNTFFGTYWTCCPRMYERQEFQTNILISCVDTVKARLAISNGFDESAQKGYRDERRCYYWLDFGNSQKSGQVVLGTIGDIQQPKGKKGCVPHLKTIAEMFDLTKVNEKKSGPSCSLAEALSKQDLFINSTLANIGCALLWKMFSGGILETQGAFLNLDTMKMNPIGVF